MEENRPEISYTSFLGTGWSFPPEFLPETGAVVMTPDEEDIARSLKILLGTGRGERFFHPKYGLGLHEMLFEPMGTTVQSELKERMKMAILIYEPRINLLSLEIDPSVQLQGELRVLLEYEIRATNSRYNLVYPFYTTEGNEARKELGL
jgi:phage baseplate assembly protein W